MESLRGQSRSRLICWALVLFAAIALFLFVTLSMFAGTFTRSIPVTVTSDRAGLVMDAGAKVKMQGVQVGRVASISGGTGATTLRLEIFPDQVQYIPANVQAQIRATTAFGAKYVDLIYPNTPSGQHVAAGQVIASKNVSTEVNTVFQNLTNVLDRVDPLKLNGVLTALADGLRGQGPAIGQATSDANAVLLALNTRTDTLKADWQAVSGFADTYSSAAHDILTVLEAASTTSATVTDNVAALDTLLLNVIGFAHGGTDLLAPAKHNLVTSVGALESTTSLLLKYNPELTCTIVGGKTFIDKGGASAQGGSNGKSAILDVATLLGKDPYNYPTNLPVVGARGGPGGKPSCGSLPDVAQNWPVRQLITNTGWGTGMDWRPNPGIGFPGYANYFPVTRAAPESPSIRYPGGPAPGPIPYPGAPPYGASLYAPDGTPLYPGLPEALPPGAPREPGPPPAGTEPLVVPAPAAMQPTPTPPLPESAVPGP